MNLSSSGHLGAPSSGINFKDLSLRDEGTWKRYGQSKLANILHTKTLDKLYGPKADNPEGEIWVSSIHPGLVETNLANEVGLGSGVLFSVLRALGLVWPAEKGCWTSLWCVAGKDMREEDCGGYFEIFRRFGEPKKTSLLVKDGKLAEMLEEWSQETMRREGWLE